LFRDKLVVRISTEDDEPEIAAIHRLAFGRDGESELALDLIRSQIETISIVAQCDERVIGHILLTEIAASVRAVILAPLAVDSKYRELQIGSTLVRTALEIAKNAGFEAVFVLGDPLYYERFGFSSQKADPFVVAWQGPHFMAVELRENALAGKGGKLQVPQAFTRV
jgi:putative acetyltransferase